MTKKLVIFLFLSVFCFGFYGCNVVSSVTTAFDKPKEIFSFCSAIASNILTSESTEGEDFDEENLITLNKFVNLFDEFLGGQKPAIIDNKKSTDKSFSQQTKVITQKLNLGSSYYNLFYNEKSTEDKDVTDSNKEKTSTTITGKIVLGDIVFEVVGDKTINSETTNYSIIIKESEESFVKVSAAIQNGEARYFVEKQKDGLKELYFEFEINILNSDTTLNLVLPEGEEDVEYKIIKKKAHELSLEITEAKNEENIKYTVKTEPDKFIYKRDKTEITKKRLVK